MGSSVFLWAQIAGGLALFLMGVSAASDGLGRSMSRQARRRMAEVTDRKSVAFGLGLLLSGVTQSSTVATSFAVGLVDIGMLSLAGSLVVMIGASVGSAFVTVLLGLPVVRLAPGFLGAAHLMTVVSKGKVKTASAIGRGIALVLTGMFLIKSGVTPLVEDPGLSSLLEALSTRPLVMGLASACVAALSQSGGMVMAIAIALASSGSLPISAIFPVVLGAHGGSSFMVLITSLQGKKNARLLGLGTAIFKIVGIGLSVPFYPLVPKLLLKMDFLSVEMSCVALQFFVKIFNTLVFLPFTGPLSRLLELIPFGQTAQMGEPAYLDRRLVEFPDLALPLLGRELVRLAGFLERETELLLTESQDNLENRLSEALKLKEAAEELWSSMSDYFDAIETSGKSPDRTETGRISYTLESLKAVKDRLNGGICPLVVPGGCKRLFESWKAGENSVSVAQYGRTLVHLVRFAMGTLALGDLGMAKDVDGIYEELKSLDGSIRREIFKKGSYGKEAVMSFLSRGTELAKACVQAVQGERMALEMTLKPGGIDGDADLVRKEG